MGTARSIETPVTTISWTTWRHIPEVNALRHSVFFCKLELNLWLSFRQTYSLNGWLLQVSLSCNSVDVRFEYQSWHRLSWGFSWCFLILTRKSVGREPQINPSLHIATNLLFAYNPIIRRHIFPFTKYTINKTNKLMVPERREVLSASCVPGHEYKAKRRRADGRLYGCGLFSGLYGFYTPRGCINLGLHTID